MDTSQGGDKRILSRRDFRKASSYPYPFSPYNQLRHKQEMVSSTLQIEQMSREEKLRALEAIWADLSKEDTELESPAWHEDVLKETEARVASGKERVEDWQTAKRELSRRFE